MFKNMKSAEARAEDKVKIVNNLMVLLFIKPLKFVIYYIVAYNQIKIKKNFYFFKIFRKHSQKKE